MPVTYLVTSDSALGAALTEQLLLAEAGSGLGEIRQSTDLADALKAEDDALILLDESAINKKTAKALCDLGEDRKKRVLFLGTPPDDLNADMIVESFPKPLRLGHILARLAFHQAAPKLRSTPVIFGPYRFEPQNRQVVVEASGNVIRLTEKETALLDYLGQNGQPVSREELLTAVWGYDGRIDTHTLETHIYQLRRKLDPGNEGINVLLNEQGAYRLYRVDGQK